VRLRSNPAISRGHRWIYFSLDISCGHPAILGSSKLPREKRKLVTSHDAFQYFARDLGFKIYAIEGLSTQDEPSSKKIAELINTIKSESVKAVFIESIENPKVVAEITKENRSEDGRGTIRRRTGRQGSVHLSRHGAPQHYNHR
jgi:Zinc-uptake complex component A periplasmic